MGNEPIITVENACKTFESDRGPVEALAGFNLEVREGEFVAIVGPSGCGKSTLLWAMAALWPLTSGSIKIYDQEVKTPRREVGMVFQQANLLPWRNLTGNIEFAFEFRGEKAKDNATRIQELIQVTQLTGFEKHYPRELSGGMQQRASIVRALAPDPKVMLMDEPFGALDAFTRDEMNVMLLELWERTKKTIVFVTHSIQEAVYLSDRVYVMTPRPGRNSRIYDIPLGRPRPLSLTTERRFFDIFGEIKQQIYDDVDAATKAGAYEIDRFSRVSGG
jgi:NitT/TauT family transport system ATP-binding protein